MALMVTDNSSNYISHRGDLEAKSHLAHILPSSSESNTVVTIIMMTVMFTEHVPHPRHNGKYFLYTLI